MKNYIFILIIFFSFQICAQNVGQTGDSIINYTDINGFKQGFWQQRYFNGKIKYEGYFRNDKPYGEFKRYDEKGRLTSILVHSLQGDTAYAKMFHENGNVAATGRYINKVKDGEWKYFNENGQLLSLETLKMEQKHGLFQLFYADGNIYHEKTYLNGELDGEEKRYYSTGQINFKANYKQGRRTGEFFVYDIDGKVLTYGKYVDDKRNGTWRFYEENGTLKAEIVYNYGIPENKDQLEVVETEEIKKLEEKKGTFDDPESFIENPEQYIFMKREKK